ncbi:TPA: GIY-YIG nuclease family protein [Photobacterium damselae]
MSSDMWSYNYHEAEIFYIFKSKKTGIIKIGITKNLESRLKNLNSHKLGGASDFSIVTSVHLGKNEAGPFETEMLNSFKSKKNYVKFQCKSEDTYSNETLNIPITDLIKRGEILLKGDTKKIREFISCREHHRQNLWSKDPETEELREIKRKYSISNTSEMINYLWEEHGVLLNNTL